MIPKESMKIFHMRLRGMMVMLILQFVLGITLATIVSFDGDGKPPLPHIIVLVPHVLLALGLFANAVYIVIVTKRNNSVIKKLARYGLAAITGAIIGGIITVLGPSHEGGSFLMGLCFLFAFVDYGVWFLRFPVLS